MHEEHVWRRVHFVCVDGGARLWLLLTENIHKETFRVFVSGSFSSLMI